MYFAPRMEELKPSDIREVMKIIAAKPGTISFAGGLPAPELFPSTELREVANSLLRDKAGEALQYGTTLGYQSLRENVARLMERECVKATSDNIIITAGSQQGLSLSGMMFLDKDDVVISESPSYLGALSAFKPTESQVVSVACDGDGMLMDDLERVLAETPKARMIYVIPNFQNPTGKTWTLERRQKLIEIASKYDIPIIEDNAYGELRYEGERVPSIASLDTKGIVVHLGSFSKILAPGLRVGWICASKEIIPKFELLKYGADLQPNELVEMIIDGYLNNYNLDEHLNRINAEYKVRRDLMIDVIRNEFPAEAKWYYPEGGMFVWIELPERINTRELLKKAVDKGVAFVPGGSFYPNGGIEYAFRINFSNMKRDKIVQGMKILADLLKEELK
ncbi:MAG: PLP-dependent aminotransferase family protein [Clostridiaceae bacterium]